MDRKKIIKWVKNLFRETRIIIVLEDGTIEDIQDMLKCIESKGKLIVTNNKVKIVKFKHYRK